VENGWFYITRAEGALDHEPFGRSPALGQRAGMSLDGCNDEKPGQGTPPELLPALRRLEGV